MEKQTVKAVSIQNVYGKEQTYVVIGEGADQVIINVGQKTFDKVKSLTEGKKEVKNVKAS